MKTYIVDDENDDEMLAKMLLNAARHAYDNGNKMAFAALIGGQGPWKCATIPEMPHQVDVLLDTIHAAYAEDKDSMLDLRFCEALDKLVTISMTIPSLSILIDTIRYEIEKEQKGTNSFSIDKEKTLDRLRKLINSNREIYKNGFSEFDEWLENERNYVIKTCGIDITF